MAYIIPIKYVPLFPAIPQQVGMTLPPPATQGPSRCGLSRGSVLFRFRVQGLGFFYRTFSPRVPAEGLGFGVWGLGFRVWGLGLGV